MLPGNYEALDAPAGDQTKLGFRAWLRSWSGRAMNEMSGLHASAALGASPAKPDAITALARAGCGSLRYRSTRSTDFRRLSWRLRSPPRADAPRQPMPVARDEERSLPDARRAVAGRTER